MNTEYEQRINEQNRLLLEMLSLDRDAEDFDEQFDQIARKLLAAVKKTDHLVQSDPTIRRTLAL